MYQWLMDSNHLLELKSIVDRTTLTPKVARPLEMDAVQSLV